MQTIAKSVRGNAYPVGRALQQIMTVAAGKEISKLGRMYFFHNLPALSKAFLNSMLADPHLKKVQNEVGVKDSIKGWISQTTSKTLRRKKSKRVQETTPDSPASNTRRRLSFSPDHNIPSTSKAHTPHTRKIPLSFHDTSSSLSPSDANAIIDAIVEKHLSPSPRAETVSNLCDNFPNYFGFFFFHNVAFPKSQSYYLTKKRIQNN